jgi:UDP-3-O-[3-hydroxymyristoyl] glucosamine N-acyltransferase
MILEMEFSAQQIAQFVGGTVEGDASVCVHTFAKIEEGVEGALSFLSDLKYEPYVYQTASSVLLVPNDFKPSQPVGATLVRVESPRAALGRLLQLYEQQKPRLVGIDPLASVDSTAKIGKDVYLGPFVTVAAGAEVGDGSVLHPHATVGAGAKVGCDCTLYPHATVYHDCIIGDRCILHAGSVVGADGFGFAPSGDHYEKIPQIGIAVLESDVELGANACVDRATMGKTVIKRGAKIDNLVQVGHNVVVGENTILCAQVGIAGSTKVGNWCVFAGQVGLANQLIVADHVTVGAKSGVSGNMPKSGETYMGSPYQTARQFRRTTAVMRNLPEMSSELHRLKKQVAALQARLDGNSE